MDSTECAYLINTTPKYFPLLPLHIKLLERYAPTLKWPIFIATESPELLPPITPVPNILILEKKDSGFFESRAASMKLLPSSIKYVFPIQEDFLLEGRPMEKEIDEAFQIFHTDSSVASIRLMPCPGPSPYDASYIEKNHWNAWKVLDFDKDSLVFTYQATLWKRSEYYTFMNTLLHKTQHLNERQKLNTAIKINLAEIPEGQQLLKTCLSSKKHLSISRLYSHPNAVYLCPWPYRPTAVVRGSLELWARDLAEREGLFLGPLE
jgi:hypothetical protein